MAKWKVRSRSIRGVYNMQQCHHINIYYQRARNAAELDTAYHRLMIDRAPSMPDLSDGCNAMQLEMEHFAQRACSPRSRLIRRSILKQALLGRVDLWWACNPPIPPHDLSPAQLPNLQSFSPQKMSDIQRYQNPPPSPRQRDQQIFENCNRFISVAVLSVDLNCCIAWWLSFSHFCQPTWFFLVTLCSQQMHF